MSRSDLKVPKVFLTYYLSVLKHRVVKPLQKSARPMKNSEKLIKLYQKYFLAIFFLIFWFRAKIHFPCCKYSSVTVHNLKGAHVYSLSTSTFASVPCFPCDPLLKTVFMLAEVHICPPFCFAEVELFKECFKCYPLT